MATPMKLYYNDQSLASTFAAGFGSWQAATPLTNLQDPRLSRVARSTDATNASSKFRFSFATAITTDALFLVGTNMQASSQWRVITYTNNTFATPVFDSGVQSFWPAGISSPDLRVIRDPDLKGMPLFAMLGQNVTANAWEVQLLDATNPAGYIQAAKLFLGQPIVTTFNFANGATFSRDANTQVIRSLGGTPYFNRHKNIRSWRLTFTAEDYAVGWEQIDALNEMSGLDRPLFVVPFPDDVDHMNAHSFLCNLSKISDLQMMAYASTRIATAFDLTEYVG